MIEPIPNVPTTRPDPTRVGVVVVEPVSLNRAALAALIEAQDGLGVVGEAADADLALAALRRLRRRASVLLCPLGLVGPHDSLWLIRAVRERLPSVRILAVAAAARAIHASTALFMGADGFVDKSVPPETFFDAIRRIARGETVVEGVAFDEVARALASLDAHRGWDPVLTERERAVLAVAAEGLTAGQIGRRLGLAGATVNTHLSRIYRKLGVSCRVAAIATAEQAGLLVAAAG